MKSAMILASLAMAESTSLKLAFTDCGAAHGKITGLTPDVLPLGTKTTTTGTGTVDEAVSAGTFEMDLKASIISQTYTGDLCTQKSFSLPLGTGTIMWDGLKCPVAAGVVNVPVDITLSGSLPAALQTVDLKVKGTSSNGDDLLCMDIKTSPISAETGVVGGLPPTDPQPIDFAKESHAETTSLKLAYTDCGAAHGKITGLTPDVLPLGAKTTATGTGTVDKAVSAGKFEMDLKASIISQTFTGDLCARKSFSLPLGTGTIAWDGLKCPVAAGAISVPVDITLSNSLPSALQAVDLKVKGTDSNGDDLLCMDIKTSPALAGIRVVGDLVV